MRDLENKSETSGVVCSETSAANGNYIRDDQLLIRSLPKYRELTCASSTCCAETTPRFSHNQELYPSTSTPKKKMQTAR